MIYWVFWVILALVMALLVAYIINTNTQTYEEHRDKKKKSVYDGLAFAGILSALVLSAFAITLSPEFYIYSKYFEHPVIGVIRFIVMMIIALLLMYYAIKGKR